MLFGGVVGFATAWGFFTLPDWQPLELFTGLAFLVSYAVTIVIWVIGAVVGGVIGSLAGAAIGASLAAKPKSKVLPQSLETGGDPNRAAP
jgi:hypothetical protein